MTGDKYCARCGAYIGNIETWEKGYYSFISTRYCERCRDEVKKRHEKERSRNYRKRNRNRNQAEDIQLDLLKQENELLRRNIIKLREQLDEERREPEPQVQGRVIIRKKKHPHNQGRC